MAKRKHRHRRQRPGVIGPALRPVAWSALLGAAMASVTVAPAYAAPPPLSYAEPGLPDRVPDAGARPVLTGPLQLPGGGPTSAAPIVPVTGALGPLAQQIIALETEVASLGEQLKALALERQQLDGEVRTLLAAFGDASDELHLAQPAAEAAAEDAYKHAAELPPGTIESDLHGLGALSRLQSPRPPGSEAEALRLKRAREAEQAANLALTEAEARLAAADTRFTGLQNTFKQREQALLDLRKRNESELVEIERQREAEEQRLGAGFVGGDTIDGLQAHPKAKQAMRYALGQLGEPYLWGAEGPSRWDCSGLMWAAYRSVGETLPRVSRDQYQATKSRRVAQGALLPGDLVFFSSSPTDASKIHHVGMYIGGGKMVHAPTTGDVVKISTVWWSRFFAATRVVGAVPAPPSTPTNPTTPPSPKPTPTTPSPEPTTPSPGPTTPSPEPTTPSPEPTPTPMPTPTPDPQPTPEPTRSPDPGQTQPADPPSQSGAAEASPTSGAAATTRAPEPSNNAEVTSPAATPE